jgi:export-related chaperone CsaA
MAGGMTIPIEHFAQLDIRVGRITQVDDIPQARKPMYKLMVDFGDGTLKQCVAGIKPFYSKEQLTGKTVVAVVNLQPKSVAGVASECMLLAAFNEDALSLLSLDRDLPIGTKVG